MYAGKTSNISDTIHGAIYMTEFEKRIVSTALFNRLHSVYQNSTVYLTFPSNRTKRFEHSLGVMELCGQIFYYSVSNSKENDLDKFFEIAKEQIQVMVSDIEEKGKEFEAKIRDFVGLEDEYVKLIIQDGIYNSLSPHNVREKFHPLYCILLESIRIAGLLHDVGHPPYSHIVEDAMSDVFEELSKISDAERTDRQKEYIRILKRYYGNGKAKLHEEISIEISNSILYESITNFKDLKDYKEDAPIPPVLYQQQVFEVLINKIVDAIFREGNDFFGNLHAIIDGALDGDRLDYVTRDAVNSGLESGKIEYKRIIPTMRLLFKEETSSNFIFCPSIKCLNSVEDFFERRWSLYKKVVYHHRVIKTDYLLKSCVVEVAKDYLKDKASIQKTKDNSLPPLISGLWMALKTRPSRRETSNAIVQWDDAWLMTILKKHYFVDYFGEGTVLKKKLCELLTNKKYYSSIVKEREQFAILDKSFAKEIHKNQNKIEETLNKFIEVSENAASMESAKGDEIFNPDVFINRVSDIVTHANDILDENKPSNRILGFLLSDAKFFFEEPGSIILDYPFNNFITDQIKIVSRKYEDRIEDVLTVFKNANTGTDKALHLYSDTEDTTNLSLFGKISSVPNKLNAEIKNFPPFFIYVSHKKTCNPKEYYFEDFLTQLGNIISKVFVEKLIQSMNEYSNKYTT